MSVSATRRAGITPRRHHAAPASRRAGITPRRHHAAPASRRADITPRRHHAAQTTANDTDCGEPTPTATVAASPTPPPGRVSQTAHAREQQAEPPRPH